MIAQLSKKAMQLFAVVTLFIAIAIPANAQKKCKNGKCPSGYACSPGGYCFRYCPRCQPYPIAETINKVDSATGSHSTAIIFQLDKMKTVSINIYDVTGRLIRTLVDERMHEGLHELVWNGKDEKNDTVNSGIYLLKLSGGDYSQTETIIVEN
jgi:hypothetical protein